MRDGAGELLDVMRAFGAGPDEAHVAAQDVPELRQLIEVPAAQERPDAEQPRVAAHRALVRVVRGGGVRRHAAQFPKCEWPVAGADAGLAEKHRAAGRLALDKPGEDQQERRGEHQPDPRRHQVERALEAAVEEAVDGELLDAKDRHAADGLEAQPGQENIEGPRHDLPFDVGLLAGFDDPADLVAWQVEARGDQQIGVFAGEDGREVGHGSQLRRPAGNRRGESPGVTGHGDHAEEDKRMGRVAADLGGEGAGLVIPAQQDRPPAQPGEERAAGDQGVGECAPRVEQRDDADERHHDKEPGNRRIEFQHERDPEIGDQPERRAFQDGAEAQVAAQQQARIVESELCERADEQGHADEQQGEVLGERGVGDGDAEPGER